jgi:hypothetical protein
MRRDSENDLRGLKEKRKYINHNIKKWVEWSFNTRNKIKYKELTKQIEYYERRASNLGI